MRVISGIVFALLFAVPGAFAAGPLGDWLMALLRFESPDQHARFDTAVRIGVTAAIGLIGAVAGIMVAGYWRGRQVRRRNQIS